MGFEVVAPEIMATTERLALMKMQVVADIAKALRMPEPFRDDAGRVALLKASAMPPERCGSDIIAAPARGPMVAFAPISVQPKGASGWEVQHAGYRGRDAARQADAFDVMEEQARRRQGKRYQPLFAKGEIEAGRLYAALVERHDAAGMRGISIETMMAGRSGGSSGGGFMDAVLAEGRRIDAMRAAIGPALVFGEYSDGDGKMLKPALSVRELVDLVCCGDRTVAQVVKGSGRHADGDRMSKVRLSLREALNRMASAGI